MRLLDLDARFFGRVDATNGVKYLQDDRMEGAQGVLFQCPKCATGKERGEEDGRRFVRGAHYIAVCFSNPIGAPVAPHEFDHNPRWEMAGMSLDDLSLSPSINLDVPENTGGCGWHGFVQKGDAR